LNIYYFRSNRINFLGVSVRSLIWLYNYREESTFTFLHCHRHNTCNMYVHNVPRLYYR